MANTYKSEVVDPGDQASRLAKDIGYQSHSNNGAVRIIPHQPDNFRGPVGFLWQRPVLEQMIWGAMYEEVENDGAGGKPQFFTLAGTPEVMWGLGWEIISMCADDFARSGRFPAIMVNDLNVKRITEKNVHLVRAVFEGYGEALRRAQLVNITGEVAVMKHSITAFCDTGNDEQLVCTWGGTCIGLAHSLRLIDGSGIRAEMPIIGLWEPGYRCNGGTWFTNLLLTKYGSVEAILRSPEAMALVKKLTTPSQSYAQTICRLLGWKPDGTIDGAMARIYGIAHITGGGVWGKFGELLPDGIGAELDEMPQPASVLTEAQELAVGTEYELTDQDAYGTLHGGCGMLLVCDEKSVDTIIQEAAVDNIRASVVGRTIKAADKDIAITSRFREGGIVHPPQDE